jgi:2-phosphoglycerate kinase
METVDITDQLSVESSNGKKTPFSLPRLTVSLASVMVHDDDAANDAYWLAQTTAEQLYRMATHLVSTSIISEIAYAVLDRYDGAAAIQYGARHGLVTPASRRRTTRPRS